MTSTFTVIINTYNQEQYIDEAVKSVLDQTVGKNNIQLFIVNCGSTDRTANKISHYKAHATILDLNNVGQACALNAAVAHAAGTYISFLDGDDKWHPTKLRRIYETFNDTHADIVCHNLMRFGIGLKPKPQYFIRGKNTIRNHFSPTSGFSFCTRLKELLFPIPESFTISADQYLITIAGMIAMKTSFVPECLGHYRLHPTNTYSGPSTPTRLKAKLQVLLSFDTFLKDDSILETRGFLPMTDPTKLERARQSIRANIIGLQAQLNDSLQGRLYSVLTNPLTESLNRRATTKVLLMALAGGRYDTLAEHRSYLVNLFKPKDRIFP